MRNHEKMHITEVMAAAGHSPEKALATAEISRQVGPVCAGRRFFIEEGKLLQFMRVQDTWPGDIVFATITLELNEERLIAQLDHADEKR